MKKLVLALMLLAPHALAADPRVITESAEPLIAATSALPGIQIGYEVSAHLPGYGLQISMFGSMPQYGDPYDQGLKSLKDILVGLSMSVQGLDEKDWVSVALALTGTSEGFTDVVVRVKPGRPDTLETWIDGGKVSE